MNWYLFTDIDALLLFRRMKKIAVILFLGLTAMSLLHAFPSNINISTSGDIEIVTIDGSQI